MNILCWLLGHKEINVFNGKDTIKIIGNNKIDRADNIKFCERCGLCYWRN